MFVVCCASLAKFEKEVNYSVADPSTRLQAPPPKWPILCRVGR